MKDLSNVTLARLIMTRLWSMYDHGGISLHRARRSSFLEHAIALIPLDNHMWEKDLDEFILEARGRNIPDTPIFLPELIVDISLFSDEQYVVLALGELGKWYAQDPMKPIDNETYVSCLERDVYLAFARLLRVGQGMSELQSLGIFFTPEEILKEGWRRDGLRRVREQHVSSSF